MDEAERRVLWRHLYALHLAAGVLLDHAHLSLADSQVQNEAARELIAGLDVVREQMRALREEAAQRMAPPPSA